MKFETVEVKTKKVHDSTPKPKQIKLSEDFWDAWNDLEPSISSVFRASKWKSKFTSLKIVKRHLEALK